MLKHPIFYPIWKLKKSIDITIDAFRNRHWRSADFIFESQSGKAQPKGRVLCLFAHFDVSGELRPYDVYHLEHLHNELNCDIVFCSTNIKLENERIRKILDARTILMISRKNKGHDFGSWKCALDILGSRIVDYDYILLVNNSVYGPVFSLRSVLDKVDASENCVLSITENTEREHHLQSYFLLLPRKVFTGKAFARFWEKFKFLDSRLNIVYGYEMGLSRALKRSKVELRAFCPTARTPSLKNPTHSSWFELVRDMNCPYFKRDLIKKLAPNEVSQFQGWLKAHTPYDPQLIQ